jgi:hypothetical protein
VDSAGRGNRFPKSSPAPPSALKPITPAGRAEASTTSAPTRALPVSVAGRLVRSESRVLMRGKLTVGAEGKEGELTIVLDNTATTRLSLQKPAD